MPLRRIISALAVAVLVGSASGCAGDQDPSALKLKIDEDSLIRELETSIPRLMKEARIPGMSLAVIRDGGIVWHKGFGIKNTKTQEPVTDDTVFEAASLTKPFFAFLIMKMVEAGEIDLDVPLVDYAPQEYLEKRYIRHPMDLEGFRSDRFRTITARHVLSHSSGLPHGGPRRPLPVLFEPGSRYRYSADGYMYLQRIVEHLKDEPLHDVMRKEVLEPLGMKDSSMVWQDRYADQAAVGHDMFGETSGRHRRRWRAHAAASLYTTAHDYALFVTSLLNDTGLKDTTIETMLSPQVDVDENVFWSLGFGIDRTDHGDAFWQWGDYGIFRNYITAFKRHRLGVVYFTNSNNGLSIGQEVVDLAIGGGRNLGLSYLGYTRYDSPGMLLSRIIVEQGIPAGQDFYREQREKDPDSMGESQINSLGYALLGAERFKEAIAVFTWNVESYPQSANVYDSLAEAYMRSGNDELAIKFYKKALEVIPNDPRPDKEFLENLKTGALANLEKLEKKK